MKVVSCQIIRSEVGGKLLGLLYKQLWWCSVLLLPGGLRKPVAKRFWGCGFVV